MHNADGTTPYGLKVTVVNGDISSHLTLKPVPVDSVAANEPSPYFPQQFGRSGDSSVAMRDVVGGADDGSASGFALLYAAAAECGVGAPDANGKLGPLAGMVPQVPTWGARADGSRAYSMFARPPATCDDVLVYEEALLCTADKLAQAADTLGGLSWTAVSRLPPLPGVPQGAWHIGMQSTEDKFVARDLARHLLASVAVADMTVPTSFGPDDGTLSSCGSRYAELLSQPVTASSSQQLFGVALGETAAYLRPRLAVSAESAASLAHGRLLMNAKLLHASRALLDALVADGVQDARAVAGQRMARLGGTSGARVAWGLEATDSPRYNTFAHAAHVAAGPLELGSGSPLPAGSLNVSDRLSAAFGDGLSALASFSRPVTDGQTSALEQFYALGLVLPDAALTDESASSVRQALIDQSVMRDAQRRGLTISSAQFPRDQVTAALAFGISRLDDADLLFAARSVADAYAREAGGRWAGPHAVRGVIPGTATAASVSSLGGGVVEGLGRLDPTTSRSPQARALAVAPLSVFRGDGAASSVPYGPRDFGATHASAFDLGYLLAMQQRRLAMSVASAAPELRDALLASAATMAAQRPLTSRVHLTPGSDGHVSSVDVTIGALPSSKLDPAFGASLRLVGNSAPALRCVAAGDRCADDVASWVVTPRAGSVQTTVAADGTVEARASFDVPAGSPVGVGSEPVFLVASSPLGGGSIPTGVFTAFTVPAAGPTGALPDLAGVTSAGQVTAIGESIGVPRSVRDGCSEGGVPCDEQQDACDDIIGDHFVPFPHTGDESSAPQVETAWQYYVGLARAAAEKSDSLGQAAVETVLTAAERDEAATERLADICGSATSLAHTNIDSSGNVTGGSDDPAVQACLDETLIDVVFLSSDPTIAMDPSAKQTALRAQLGCCDEPGCDTDGNSNPLCRKAALTSAGLGIVPYVSPTLASGAVCGEMNLFAQEDTASGLAPAWQVANDGLNTAWFSVDNTRGALSGAKLIDSPDRHWRLVGGDGKVVLDSDPASGRFPGCLALSGQAHGCDEHAVYYSQALRPGSVSVASGSCGAGRVSVVTGSGSASTTYCISQLGDNYTDSRRILWQVEGALWTLSSLAKYMPETLMNVAVPVADLEDASDEAPLLSIYGTGRLVPPTSITATAVSQTLDDNAASANSMPPIQSPGSSFPRWASGIAQIPSYALAGSTFGSTVTSVASRHQDIAPAAFRKAVTDLASDYQNNGHPAVCASHGSAHATALGGVKSWGEDEWSICEQQTMAIPSVGGWDGQDWVSGHDHAFVPNPLHTAHIGIQLAGDHAGTVNYRSVFLSTGDNSSHFWDYGTTHDGGCAPFGPWIGAATYSSSFFSAPIAGCDSLALFHPSSVTDDYAAIGCVHATDAGASVSGGCVQAKPYCDEQNDAPCGDIDSHYVDGDVLLMSDYPGLVYEPLHSMLTPYSCSPSARAVAWVNAFEPTSGCDAGVEFAAAMVLACDLVGSGVAGDSFDPPPQVNSLDDVEDLSTWLTQAAIETRRNVSRLYVTSVPKRVVDDFASGSVGSGAVGGEHGAHVLELEQSLQSVSRNWLQAASDLDQLSAQIRTSEAEIKLDNTSNKIALQNLVIQTYQVEESIARATVDGTVGFIEGATAEGGPNLAKMLGSAADTAIAIGYGTLIEGQLNQIKSLTMEQNGEQIAVILAQLMQNTQQTYADINKSMTEVRSSVASALVASQAVMESSAEAQQQVAKIAGANYLTESDEADPDETAEVMLPVDTVLARQYAADQARYSRAERSAKELACVARRSIEQKIGRHLPAITEQVGVESPAAWYTDIGVEAGFTGAEYTETQDQSGAVDGSNVGGLIAKQFISDYVDRLEDLAVNYDIVHPYTIGHEARILSFRNDIINPNGGCWRPTRNLLTHTDDIEAPAWVLGYGSGSPVFSRTNKNPLVEDGPLPASGAASSVLELREYGGIAMPDLDLGDPVGLLTARINLDPGNYVFSWWAAWPDGGSVPAHSYAVAVASFGDSTHPGGPIAGPVTFNPSTTATGSLWGGGRSSIAFTVSQSGTYAVAIAPAPENFGGNGPRTSVDTLLLLTEPQLEVDPGSGQPTDFQETGQNAEAFVHDCVGTKEDLDAFFSHHCDDDGTSCGFQSHYFQIGSSDRNVFDPGSWPMIESVAVNLVGSNVHDCAPDAGDACYGTGFERYSLLHDATNVFFHPVGPPTISNQRFSFDSAGIVDGNALSIERYLTMPLAGADSALVNQQGILRTELAGRPIWESTFQLVINDSTALDWDNVEDIQILLNYSTRRMQTPEGFGGSSQ